MSDPFIGQIQAFGFNFAPRGWAKCDGQLMDISSSTALFSLLGTIYGGDGRTNFSLPDLRSRTPMHFGGGTGLSPRKIGQKFGTETVTLTEGQMPSHAHSGNVELAGNVKCCSGAVNQDSPAGNSLAKIDRDNRFSNAEPDAAMREGGVKLSGPLTTGSSGGSQAHSNMPPCLVLNYCIALTGIYPSRS